MSRVEGLLAGSYPPIRDFGRQECLRAPNFCPDRPTQCPVRRPAAAMDGLQLVPGDAWWRKRRCSAESNPQELGPTRRPARYWAAPRNAQGALARRGSAKHAQRYAHQDNTQAWCRVPGTRSGLVELDVVDVKFPFGFGARKHECDPVGTSEPFRGRLRRFSVGLRPRQVVQRQFVSRDALRER